ncbi:MAG: hypothetical protein KC418_04915 [Anaerolineales bacterium]|nr:hypothetical protein [Anaerolineales bacterium]MCB8953030.1 hypothetical protein [Ardenticatenales bacterium]
MFETPEAKSDFLQRYANVVAMSWADEDFLHRLVKEPVVVLREAGIGINEDARVNVITIESKDSGRGAIEDQIELWEKGAQTGSYDLLVAMKPEGWSPENIELADSQLMAVAGGLEEAAGIDISCCCCTPCCCCT